MMTKKTRRRIERDEFLFFYLSSLCVPSHTERYLLIYDVRAVKEDRWVFFF